MRYAAWPFFLTIAALLVFANTRFFACLDDRKPGNAARVRTIDGLRGFLALSVFFHHALVTQDFLVTGVWRLPPSRFYSLLGQFGVAFFFMITGYLFWQRMIVEKGRPNWGLLYLGRLFRIGPLYLVSIAGLFLLLAMKSGWHLQSTLGGLLKSGATWMPFGALGIGADMNHYPKTWTIIAGVVWTLQYEWVFYASLALTAIATRSGRVHLVAPIAGLVAISAFAQTSPGADSIASNDMCAALFLAGMICASLQAVGVSCPGTEALRSVAAILLVAGTSAFSSIYQIGAVALLAPAFFIIVTGCSLFGLLTRRSAIRLGEVSYSIYMLHGLLLTAVFICEPIKVFALSSDPRYWLVIIICAFLLVVLSATAYLMVERPGIALGRSLGRALRSRHAGIVIARAAAASRR